MIADIIDKMKEKDWDGLTYGRHTQCGEHNLSWSIEKFYKIQCLQDVINMDLEKTQLFKQRTLEIIGE